MPWKLLAIYEASIVLPLPIVSDFIALSVCGLSSEPAESAGVQSGQVFTHVRVAASGNAARLGRDSVSGLASELGVNKDETLGRGVSQHQSSPQQPVAVVQALSHPWSDLGSVPASQEACCPCERVVELPRRVGYPDYERA